MTMKELDIRRMSVSSAARKELSISSKILNRLGSCGRTSRANGVNQIAIIDILVALTIIGLSKSIYELLFEVNKEEEDELNGTGTTDSSLTIDGLTKGIGKTTPSPPEFTIHQHGHEKTTRELLGEMSMYLFFGSIMFFQSVQLLLGFILLRGSIKRNMTHCRIWFIGQILLMLLEVGLFVFFATVIPEKIASWLCSILFLGSILYKIYCLYVVKKFLLELKTRDIRKASQCSSGPPLIPNSSKYEEQTSPEEH